MEPGFQAHPAVADAMLPDPRALTGGRQQLRRFDFQDVEGLTRELARRLQDDLGSSTLEQMQFQAVPRGGLFVLGYLSYFLNLRPQQLEPLPGAPLVLVDDCSISGARFGRYRREHPGPIYFAHLLSHPALRANIRQESQVLGCVAVADLTDLAPTLFPEPADYQQWHQDCAARVGSGRYWIGIPERIAFPWTEPDTILFNPSTGQAEPGWRLVSPDRCLNNRQLLGMPLGSGSAPQFRIPDAVAFHLTEDRVSLCDLRSEGVYSLQGPAALLWRALAAYGESAAAAEQLIAVYEVSPGEALADVHRFVEQMLQLHLLEECSAEASSTTAE